MPEHDPEVGQTALFLIIMSLMYTSHPSTQMAAFVVLSGVLHISAHVRRYRAWRAFN